MFTKEVKRGFILSLDAAVAGVVFIIMVAVIANYAIKSEENVFSNLQIVRTGSDITAVMEQKGILDTLDNGHIEDELEDMLDNMLYGMRMRVDYTEVNDDLGASGFFEVGDAIPNDRFVGSGKRFFVVINNGVITNYAFARYWVWIEGEEED